MQIPLIIMADTTVINGAEAQKKDTLPVFLIHSRQSLVRLDDFLSEYGTVGFLRIVYDNKGEETDRTIAILNPDVYDTLCKEGYNKRTYGQGFVIAPYKLNDHDIPASDGRAPALFVPVPKSLCENDVTVMREINDKLKHLVEWKIIPDKSWEVKAPLQSREKGGIRGGCYITFKDVPVETIALIRILLTDTYWPNEDGDEDEKEDKKAEKSIFRCFWAQSSRDRKDHSRGKGFNDNKVKSSTESNSESSESNSNPSDKNVPREPFVDKAEKKKIAITKAAARAVPVKKSSVKKAPTIPLCVQPTLLE